MSARWDPRDEPEPISLAWLLIDLVVFLFVIVSFVLATALFGAAMG